MQGVVEPRTQEMKMGMKNMDRAITGTKKALDRARATEQRSRDAWIDAFIRLRKIEDKGDWRHFARTFQVWLGENFPEYPEVNYYQATHTAMNLYGDAFIRRIGYRLSKTLTSARLLKGRGATKARRAVKKDVQSFLDMNGAVPTPSSVRGFITEHVGKTPQTVRYRNENGKLRAENKALKARVKDLQRQLAEVLNILPEDWVYFVRGDDAIKIGHSTDLRKRTGKLRSENFRDLDFLTSLPGSLLLEQSIQQKFDHLRIPRRNVGGGEWFKAEADLLQFIELVRIDPKGALKSVGPTTRPKCEGSPSNGRKPTRKPRGASKRLEARA